MAGTALVAALGATLFGCKTLEIEAKTGDIANCFIKPANPMEMKCWTNNEEPHFIWSGPVKLHLINVCRPCPDGTCPKCPDGTETTP